MIAAAGQLLPWLAGMLLPVLLLGRESGRLPLLVGVGFLVGAVMVYAGLRWVGVAPLLLLSALLVPALGSVVLLWRQAWDVRSHSATGQQEGAMLGGVIPSLFSKSIWCWLLLALISGHLIFSLFDLLQRPLFPWDAWTTWTYRAKAWFLAGGVMEVVSPPRFWEGLPGQVYSIDAYGYPDLSSIYQYWSALTLGEWSDGWVAFPWWLLGVAILFGIYGLGRRLGFSPAIALFLAYLFISLPMVGIHMTLAGYSDLWMAGYVGLGFAAILAGQVRNSWRELALGLLLCAFAVLLKKEGVVWLVLALWVVWIQFARRWWWSVALVGVVVAGVLSGTLRSPDIGWSGLQQGRLLLPAVGVVQLQLNDVLEPFLRNFFMMGSWNLLWYLLISTVVLGLINRKNRESRIALSIIIWPLIAILALFVFSDQGAWAQSYTAINRLFIHFLPAWLLALGVIFHALPTVGERRA